MNNKQKQVIENLNGIGFLYDAELVYTHSDYDGCHISVRSEDYQYIMVTFKDNNHIVKQKFYSSIIPKKLTYKEGREIWNGIINKKNNIKKLIDKL